jgi:hypothetical protein
MQLRRSFATTAAALIAVPLLASCGFNYNTDLVSDNVTGTSDRTNVVDVLAATIVASGPDEGTFVANLSNNDQEAGAVFESLEGSTADPVTANDFAAVSIPPGGYVNLADGYDITVSGSFGVGDVVTLSIGFADGSTSTLGVPVVRACGEYAGLDPAAPASPVSPGASSSAGSSTSPSASPVATPSTSPSTSATAETEEQTQAYSCDLVETEPSE